MTDQVPRIAEVERRIDDVKKRLATLEGNHKAVDVRYDTMSSRLDRMEADMRSMIAKVECKFEKRFDKLDSSLGWLVKLIIGSIVTALLGFIFTGGLQG